FKVRFLSYFGHKVFFFFLFIFISNLHPYILFLTNSISLFLGLLVLPVLQLRFSCLSLYISFLIFYFVSGSYFIFH
ncbi:hypothetical protein GLOIN_2v1573945, partial [Rhizophagus irregularis DAOM 181602=DAOM 197198]